MKKKSILQWGPDSACYPKLETCKEFNKKYKSFMIRHNRKEELNLFNKTKFVKEDL